MIKRNGRVLMTKKNSFFVGWDFTLSLELQAVLRFAPKAERAISDEIARLIVDGIHDHPDKFTRKAAFSLGAGTGFVDGIKDRKIAESLAALLNDRIGKFEGSLPRIRTSTLWSRSSEAETIGKAIDEIRTLINAGEVAA